MSYGLFEGFIESSPFVEKITAFEKYFTSQIDLYDKVYIKYNVLTFFWPMYKDVVAQKPFFLNRMKLKEKAASWWTTKTCLGTNISPRHYLILLVRLKTCLKRYWTAWV